MRYERPPNQGREINNLPAQLLPTDYYSVLADVIGWSQADTPEGRKVIYALARTKLRQQLQQKDPQPTREEIEAKLQELERAISTFEADASGQHDNGIFRAPLVDAPPEQVDAAPEPSANAIIIAPERPLPSLDTIDVSLEAPLYASVHSAGVHAPPPAPPYGGLWSHIGRTAQLVGASLLAVVIYSVMTGQFEIRKSPPPPLIEPVNPASSAAVQPVAPTPVAQEAKSAVVQAPPEPQPALPFPVPTTYGIYVVSDGQLTELEMLPIKVPDSRVMMSAEITRPSNVVLANGQVSFLIYRRDLMNSVPDKVSVRVVARVMRETTFKNGKATVANVEGTWRIRSNAYDFRIAPVAGRPEMILIQSAAEQTLPAGRYALAFNSFGYDFTVAGTITAAAQCLEQFEAVQGPAYSECRTP